MRTFETLCPWLSEPLATEAELAALVSPMDAQIDADTDFALASPFPSAEMASGGVFADPHAFYRQEIDPHRLPVRAGGVQTGQSERAKVKHRYHLGQRLVLRPGAGLVQRINQSALVVALHKA